VAAAAAVAVGRAEEEEATFAVPTMVTIWAGVCQYFSTSPVSRRRRRRKRKHKSGKSVP
jgi:hypothetical protein